MYTSRTGQDPLVFPQPDDANVSIWRYTDLAKLLYGLDRRSLVLPRVDLLRDPYEGVPTRFDRAALVRTLQASGASSANIDINAISERFNKDVPNKLRRSIFVSSWHMNPSESEAMWRLYCGETQGVALRTTYAKFDASIPLAPHRFIGLVRYLDYETEGGGLINNNVLGPVMCKRRSFAHEHEVRLITWDIDLLTAAVADDERPKTLEIPWDAESAIDAVYVNPYADEWYFEAIRAALRRFAPKLATAVEWSQIRRDPWESSIGPP